MSLLLRRRRVTASGIPTGTSVLIRTTDNPQTVINNYPINGQLFIFEAGTHNIGANLVPSANNQVFRGVTDGIPVNTVPVDPDGGSLGVSKVLWPNGTPTSIVDGGNGTHSFMAKRGTPYTYSGITIQRLKIQNFGNPTRNAIQGDNGAVMGTFTKNWTVEECWLDNGISPIFLGVSAHVRKNRITNARVYWMTAYYGNNPTPDKGGTAVDPCIVEDNEVLNTNVTQEGVTTGSDNRPGNPQWGAGMKLLVAEHVIVRRNYINTCHGPGIWFDAFNDDCEIYDNILVDCGIFAGWSNTPHIFWEINDTSYDGSHGGAVIRNNWCLGEAASIRISHSHGTAVNPILVYENTVDSDSGRENGIHLSDNQRSDGGNGDSTASHPAINTISMPSGTYFCDFIEVYDNVMRRRHSTGYATSVPVAGCQHAAPTADPERNFEWRGNKYEINSAITTPFKWDTGPMNWTSWQLQRAGQNDVQGAGPFFDAAGSFVTWNGTKQFADTTCGWEV